MDLNVNVKFDATPALVGCVNTLATAMGGIIPQVSNGKATIPEVTEGEVAFRPTPQEATAPTPAPVVEEKSADITDEQLRAFVGPKAKEHGKDKIFAILDELGVKRVSDLTQEQRKVFMDQVNVL